MRYLRDPSPHHWKTDPLEGFRQIKNQSDPSLISFSCLGINSFHLQQGSPHTLRAAPPLRPSVTSHSTRYLCCQFETSGRSQGFPLTNHRGHKRNGTLARDVLRDQEEHRCTSLLRLRYAPFIAEWSSIHGQQEVGLPTL